MGIKRAFGLFMTVLLLFSVFTGCGSGKKADSSTGNFSAGTRASGLTESIAPPEQKAFTDTATDEQKQKSTVESPQNTEALTSTGVETQSVSNIILSQRKVIRNADVTIEVEDFNAAYARVNSIISAFGYIQEANISRDKVHVDSKTKLITKGTIVLRVDKDRFDSVLGSLFGLGEVLGQSISADDVTDKFFDTESRLRLLKYEQSRLEDYLKKITDPDTIFKTESRLTDIRHEIEGLTGTLNKWNNLVQLSTITLNMSEKLPASAVEVKEKNYLQRLGDSFTESAKAVIAFCGDLLIFIVQILPALVFMGLAALLMYFAYRKIRRRRGRLPDKDNDDDRNASM
jgi:hypothetical protein